MVVRVALTAFLLGCKDVTIATDFVDLADFVPCDDPLQSIFFFWEGFFSAQSPRVFGVVSLTHGVEKPPPRPVDLFSDLDSFLIFFYTL
jgi:hypothetical protein